MGFSSFVWWVVAIYFAWSCYGIGSMWFPPTCQTPNTDNCIKPRYDLTKPHDMHFYVCSVSKNGQINSFQNFWNKSNISLSEAFSEELQIPLLPGTRKNGTVWLAVELVESGKKPRLAAGTDVSLMLWTTVQLSRYLSAKNTHESFLLGPTEQQLKDRSERKSTEGRPVTHLKSKINLRLVLDDRLYDRNTAPGDLPYLYQAKGKKYVQMLYSDELHVLRRDMFYLSSNESKPNPFITLNFKPTSVGTVRMLFQFQASMKMLHSFGFSEDETDQVLLMLSPDHLYRLALTYLVSLLHIIFSFLAFKNDVGFWRGKQNYAGISSRAVIGNCISEIIIFLFLLDSPNTSWLVLGSCGIGAIIDIWKVKRVLKYDMFGNRAPQENDEAATDQIDSKGMYYLSLILYPLVIGWAIYSLYTKTHRSWWSWFIGSAANGVYGFGFLLMTPQIFVNYRLKSVAHMPWRAMTYKVFNTFVDDIFAWVIDMPTIHRLATLRDDIVFFIYLYQRWIYPVDKTRVNEFGYAGEELGAQEETEEAKIEADKAKVETEKAKVD